MQHETKPKGRALWRVRYPEFGFTERGSQYEPVYLISKNNMMKKKKKACYIFALGFFFSFSFSTRF